MKPIDGDALFCRFWSLADPYVKQEKVCPSQVWNQAATMAREAPTITPPNEWVSLEERLPDISDEYIVCTEDAEVFICEYLPSVKQWWDRDAFVVDKRITHWMPLPAPPDRLPSDGEEAHP